MSTDDATSPAAQPAPRPTEELRAEERPECDHHWVAHHQPDFPDAIYWIATCSACGEISGSRLAEEVAPLLDRLAVVDRERADLRAENERHEVFMRAIKDCRDDPARAIALNDIINGKAIIAAHVAESERDEAHAQLAAARADLRETLVERDRETLLAEVAGRRVREVQARAVAIMQSWNPGDPAYKAARELHTLALSAAPQPEPERNTCDHGYGGAHQFIADPAVPMRWERCPGPAASGTPDVLR